jgi:hypothetical protein
MEPNDVDCVLLFRPGRQKDSAAVRELKAGLPFLDIAMAAPKRFEQYVSQLFAADRNGVSKGMIEVLL